MKHLFVVAHPDDEVLGAGAFIYNAIKNNDQVRIIILNADFEKTRREMFEDIEKSHKILGITDRVLFSYKNMSFHLESHRDIVENIEKEIVSFKPDYIFTHFDGDLHNDHRITSICTQQASRLWQRHSSGYKPTALLFFEVPSSTDWCNRPFAPDTFCFADKESIYAKIAALAVYKNVVRPAPHPRSEENIVSIATVRGAQIGYRYAEGFKTCWRDKL